ncbi:MAG: hypothetical protein NW206_04375 [Hyphomonadaceae bacterium]|nr:hypothetical protein [Hyphomonadaceae bacterium]
MRAQKLALALAAALCVALPMAASAQTSNAQSLYVERRALIELDERCGLFGPNVRHALEAGAAQASGALLRSGWTSARLAELEQASVNAARGRACEDSRTISAVRAAEAGFASWSRTYSMSFAGAERVWLARRTADIYGWRLYQQIPTPTAATFGVAEHQDEQQLTFSMPATGPAPASVQLVMRDPARAGTNLLDLRGRTTSGLAAGLASPNASQSFFANSRRTEREANAPARFVFTFPGAAFQRLLQLDPRETIAIDIDVSGRTQRYLIEVGDIAAARAFLAISAES